MTNERIPERKTDREMERCSRLILIAIEAKERDMLVGICSGKGFAVMTGELADAMLNLQKKATGLDFVVSYKEGGRIKYSVVKKAGPDEVDLIEPAINTISTIPYEQFDEEWNSTDNWLMVINR
ncbi:MAG: hypothetical protein NT162_00385 [Candidatus Woesebacteria bacterium]|nr:hypothetical protein [Candidatus Woesebacteria bacterium]